MRVTDKANEAILGIINRAKLNPQNTYFEIKLLENGAVGIGFNNKLEGVLHEYGDLKTAISFDIDMNGVVIDYGVIGDDKGIMFLKESGK
jgi:hypothetical protein